MEFFLLISVDLFRNSSVSVAAETQRRNITVLFRLRRSLVSAPGVWLSKAHPHILAVWLKLRAWLTKSFKSSLVKNKRYLNWCKKEILFPASFSFFLSVHSPQAETTTPLLFIFLSSLPLWISRCLPFPSLFADECPRSGQHDLLVCARVRSWPCRWGQTPDTTVWSPDPRSWVRPPARVLRGTTALAQGGEARDGGRRGAGLDPWRRGPQCGWSSRVAGAVPQWRSCIQLWVCLFIDVYPLQDLRN